MQKLLRRQRRGVAALTVLALLMAMLAVFHKGVPAAQLQLNDGGVWVTNRAMSLVGHLNYPSRTLDGGVRADSNDFDVSQAANTVLLHDTKTSSVASIDTAAQLKGDGAAVRDGLTLLQGGQVAVAADARTGKVWILDPDDVDTFNPEQDPTLDKLAGVRAIPGDDGVVHLVTPDGAVRKVVGGKAVDDGRIQGLADLATASLTVVGDTLVVLDKAGSAVRTTKGSVAVDAPAKLVLQMPGAANDKVLLASPDSYLWAPLGGGNAVVTPNGKGAGTPAAPAFLDGCGYLAWSGSGVYVRDCAKDADDQVVPNERLAGFKAIAFRVNRDVIVLNDLANGMILLVNDQMRPVENWTVIENSIKKQDDTQTSTEITDELASPEKRETNTQPEAKDDDYGVRPGRTFTLPVLENDADADGDLLTASVKKQPDGATVSQLRGGEALSIAVPGDATGQYSFTYTADDGRQNGTADAKVTVKVFPDSVNEPPAQKRQSSVKVSQKGEVSYSILPDFRDPESDPIFVSGIAQQPAGLSVKWRPDGVLTVKDLGTGGVGRREVKVQVSDGSSKATEGTLVVNVASEQLPPVANADHVAALKDSDVVVKPLANDVDPLGGQLRLTTVAQPAAGQSIQPDYTTGVFTFKGSTPGTFYVSYQIANASSTPATGYVRIDVAEPAEGNPVAGDDLAMLPAGGSVVLDPLANDGDPSGGVLVLKSVEAPPSAGMAVEIIDHHLLRISAPIGLKGPVDFPYTVSNGPGQATGRVTVLPLPAAGSATPPTAMNDTALVRLNDIVTIPVLDNDLSPSGLPLSIDPRVTIEGDAAAGDVFVSRDVVRFRAKKAGQFRVNYTVRDTASNYATGQVVINVNPLEPLTNQAPLPQPIFGRVLAGSKVVIPVPVNGIDPDGDSVSFVGLGSSALLGTAVATADAIEYTAPERASGTDTFTYEVADRFGEKKASTVRVGIAPPNATNQSPVAVPDDVATRPDRSLTVNAVANDTDPDGDALTLVAGSVAPTDDKTTAAASIDKGLIKLKTPAEEGVLHYFYGVSDGRGGSGKGVVTVKVSKDAVLKAPVARDDVVTEAQIKDKTSVEVDVLTNDYDPDGSVDDLKVSSGDPGVTAANGKLTIPLTEQRQVVLYTVTDIDDKTAKAAVVVPPSAQGRPYIDEAKVPLKVKAGELLPIPLADVVIVRAGHSPMITFAAKVKAGAGADTTELVKDPHTLQFQATKDFAGLSSVTFEVTDGNSPEDPQGRTATLTVPILVEAAAAVQHPPVFRGSDVTAGAGEPATVVDLKQMVTDEDPGDLDKLKFVLGAVSPGFTVTLNGTKLEVSAPVDAKAGTTGTAALTVTDGSTPAVPGTVQLKATASTQPLMSIKTAVVNDAKAGFPSTVDLAGYITNPFAAKNLPVTIVGNNVSGVPGGQATFNGLVATVTPPAGYHGQMVVTYTAQDGTKDASRQVQGTIELTVRDKPDPPTAVTAETHLSKTATVSWSAGANNGATIDKFTVYWSGGSKDCGQVTTCLIDTLSNNTTYTFTVTGTNVVGESDKSVASNAVRPDVKPNPPGTPVGTFGDKQIALTWAAAVVPDGGSAVKEYTVEISPAAGGGNTKLVTSTSLTWTGLTNGTAYTFRVLAKNDAIDPSGWSGSSTPVVPAGLPFQPAAPKAVKDPVSALAPSATISWAAPNGNGDANMTYEMRRTGAGTVLYTGTGLSAHVTMSVETADQTFEVRAQNKAGWGPWSPASNGVRGFQTPGAVTGLAVSATGANNTVAISFGAAAGNGATASEIKYYWTAGGVTQSIAAGGGTVASGAFPNGQNVSVAVYAVSTVNGESTQGTSTSKTVNAYGPPTSPSVSCGASGTSISCSWSGGNANGRNTNFVVSGDWSTANGGPSGSHDFGNVGYSQTRSLCVKAVQDGGTEGANNCNSARTQDPPPPTVTVSKGARVNTPTCSTSSCAYITAATANFNTSVTCSVVGASSWAATWTQGGNATATSSPNYYGYPGTTVTVTCSGGGQTATGSMVWY